MYLSGDFNYHSTMWGYCHSNPDGTTLHLAVLVNDAHMPNNDSPVYLGVTLDHSLTYINHLENLCCKVNTRNRLLHCLAGSSWRAYTWTLHTGALALVYSSAEYATPVGAGQPHKKLDYAINNTMCIITGCLRPTETTFLPVLSEIMPHDIMREHCVAKLVITVKEILTTSYINRSALQLVPLAHSNLNLEDSSLDTLRAS